MFLDDATQRGFWFQMFQHARARLEGSRDQPPRYRQETPSGIDEALADR